MGWTSDLNRKSVEGHFTWLVQTAGWLRCQKRSVLYKNLWLCVAFPIYSEGGEKNKSNRKGFLLIVNMICHKTWFETPFSILLHSTIVMDLYPRECGPIFFLIVPIIVLVFATRNCNNASTSAMWVSYYKA